MKSENTLTWFPAQIPAVRSILGDAVIAVAKQGRPINTRTLCDYIRYKQKKHHLIDKKQSFQTAIDVLRGNQDRHGHI